MKKNLLTVLILALLIVNIVLTSVMMFSVMSTNGKTAELVTNIATALSLELTVPGEEKEQISLEDTQGYPIAEAMTIPLKSENEGDKTRYIMFEVELSLNKKHEDYKTYYETIADRENLIEDAIRTVVMTHTESECRNDTEGLKAEILEAVQNLFQSDFIYNIAISHMTFG